MWAKAASGAETSMWSCDTPRRQAVRRARWDQGDDATLHPEPFQDGSDEGLVNDGESSPGLIPRAFQRLTGHGMSVGVELPLDNDFARASGRTSGSAMPGLPDVTAHRQLAELVDRLGFRSLFLRDVPMWLPSTFGDAGQVFDPIPYLGYLAAATQQVVLATAGVVLPFRNPVLLAKQAATVDVLSAGRFIMGVTTGDRPEEYPLLGIDFEQRDETYRHSVVRLRQLWAQSATEPDTEPKILPAPTGGTIPLAAVGRGEQISEWIAQHMDAYVTYYRPAPMMGEVAARWNASTPGHKPLFVAMQVDVDVDPSAPAGPLRFGVRAGRHALLDQLRTLEDAGVAHVALNLRHSRRAVADVLTELSDSILGKFGG